MNAIDEVANRYHRLVVLRFHGTNHYRKRVFVCRCDCGNEVLVAGRNLRSGNTKSCGCLKRDNQCNLQHGESRVGKRTTRYGMWIHAKRRAKQKGLPFNLEVKDVPVIPDCCPVLGIPIRTATCRQNDNSPTLDRIIGQFGYVKGNVRIISWRANMLKRDATLEELRAVANDAELIYADRVA